MLIHGKNVHVHQIHPSIRFHTPFISTGVMQAQKISFIIMNSIVFVICVDMFAHIHVCMNEHVDIFLSLIKRS